MTYIIYDDGNNFVILEQEDENLYSYFAECETKAAAEKLCDAMNSAEKK